MATTFPLPTLAASVSASGILAPTYAEIFESLQASFKAIYGTDAYIAPDSQDGQLLAVFARAISDCNDAAIAVWNSFSPVTAQGQALSNNVKINGIARLVSTNGSVTLRVVGTIGTTITDGVAADASGNRWLLPTTVIIPSAGQIDVTALAEEEGAVSAVVGSITSIVTPTLGWQTVTNPTAATPGAPIEMDAELRRRQTLSTALPSSTVLDGIVGTVADLDGVIRIRGYENDTDATNADGMPEHSISIVVEGGVASEIAEAIMMKKTPGAFTYGTTVVVVNSPAGVPYNIRFFRPTLAPLALAITIRALAGYTTSIGEQIKQSLVDYVNDLGIGMRSDLGRLYLPAQFFGGLGSATFEVNALAQAKKPASPTAADVTIAFNELATLTVADVALTVT